MSTRASILPLALLVLAACEPKKTAAADDDTKPSPSTSAPLPPTPRAIFSAAPLSQFADAGDLDGKPPFEQARDYEAAGQLWMARLLIEKKALGPDATKAETELLAKICVEQADEPCVAECSTKLGRKIKLDGGVPRATADAGREHVEPDSDLARARDLFLHEQFADARKLVEPKVLDGKASKEEIRILKLTCKAQGDRMCVALCDAKLR